MPYEMCRNSYVVCREGKRVFLLAKVFFSHIPMCLPFLLLKKEEHVTCHSRGWEIVPRV
jgi:hypothetical protein